MATENGQSFNQPSLKPSNKVTASALAGAVSTIVFFALGAVGVVVDPTVATGITFVVSAVVGYFVKERSIE